MITSYHRSLAEIDLRYVTCPFYKDVSQANLKYWDICHLPRLIGSALLIAMKPRFSDFYFVLQNFLMKTGTSIFRENHRIHFTHQLVLVC